MMTETATFKPYQDCKTAYALKDGRVFVAKCSPAFYGHVTPGWILDDDGHGGAEITIRNDEIECELWQYGLLAYWKGQPVGLSAHARNPRTPRERKAAISITTAPGVYIKLTRNEFNRQVTFAWERLPDKQWRCKCGVGKVAQCAPYCYECKTHFAEVK